MVLIIVLVFFCIFLDQLIYALSSVFLPGIFIALLTFQISVEWHREGVIGQQVIVVVLDELVGE